MNFIICVPPGRDTVAGSKRVRCAHCGQVLAIAPSGWRRMRQENLDPLCWPCAQKVIAADPDPKIQPVQPDQVAEILAHQSFERRN